MSITGKVEAVRVDDSSSNILGLLNDLMNFRTALKESLKDIDGIGDELLGQTHKMKDELKVYLRN